MTFAELAHAMTSLMLRHTRGSVVPRRFLLNREDAKVIQEQFAREGYDDQMPLQFRGVPIVLCDYADRGKPLVAVEQ